MFNKCSVCICIRFLPPSIPHLLCSYLEGTFLLSLDLGGGYKGFLCALFSVNLLPASS